MRSIVIARGALSARREGPCASHIVIDDPGAARASTPAGDRDVRVERALMLGTPVVAMAVVAAGLDYGAPHDERTAVVYAAPASRAGTGLAWQIETLEEAERRPRPGRADRRRRDGARGGAGGALGGATNEDGIAEVGLRARGCRARSSVEVRAGGALLAAGQVDVPAPSRRSGVTGLGPSSRSARAP